MGADSQPPKPGEKCYVRRDSSGRFIENKNATVALSQGVRLHRPKPKPRRNVQT